MARFFKLAQIFLTLIFGNITGIVFYDSFVLGIPDLILDSTSFYNIARVSLGAFLLVCITIGLTAAWRKAYTTLLINGFLLLISLLLFAFLNTLQLARNYEKLDTIEKYKTITDTVFKCVMLALAMFFSFSMSSDSSYSMLPISDRKL